MTIEAVALIIPVLGRPHRVVPTMESVEAATPEPHRLVFLASDDDRTTVAALEAAGAEFLVVPAARGSWACKINDGYRATNEPWIFTGADDLAFHPEWFPRALAWAREATGVIGTNDICNPRVMQGQHSTHSLFRRAYVDEHGTIDRPGLVLHEGYPHDYADDEAIATAMARGAYVHAFDAIVEHLHPMAGKAEDDDTYRLGRQHTKHGRQLFLRRRPLWMSPAPAAAPPARRPAVVITACYGGVDTELHGQAEQDIPVNWLCFTDQPDLRPPAPWTAIHAPVQFDHPNLAAKVHKATPTVDATDVVWIDASMQITSRSFVREALAARHQGVAVFRHPRRDCIYLEAEASLGAEAQGGKYAGQPLREQVAAYRAEGHPEHGGLYACGVVAWDLANPQAVELGRAWLAECERWSWQDQLSFPVVCRRLGTTPGIFPLRQIERAGRGFLANRWLRIWPHTTALPPAPPVAASIVMPYTSDDEYRQAARRYVLDWYARHHPTWELIEGRCAGPWSKGEAVADAVQRATHDILVVADADSIVAADMLVAAAQRVADGAAWVVPHRAVYRLSEAHTHRVYAGAAPQPKDLCRPAYVGLAGGGITVLNRHTWEQVGGIDPRFVGWGGEDLAFGWALETLCGPPVRLGAPLFHLWHQPEAQGERRRGGPASEALAGRYRQARGNRDLMLAVVGEHATRTAAA